MLKAQLFGTAYTQRVWSKPIFFECTIWARVVLGVRVSGAETADVSMQRRRDAIMTRSFVGFSRRSSSFITPCAVATASANEIQCIFYDGSRRALHVYSNHKLNRNHVHVQCKWQSSYVCKMKQRYGGNTSDLVSSWMMVIMYLISRTDN